MSSSLMMQREKLRRASVDETESPLHVKTEPGPKAAARVSVRRSAVAQTPRDQGAGLGDIELRATGLDFDEGMVYAGRPSVFGRGQVAAGNSRNLTLGDEDRGW